MFLFCIYRAWLAPFVFFLRQGQVTDQPGCYSSGKRCGCSLQASAVQGKHSKIALGMGRQRQRKLGTDKITHSHDKSRFDTPSPKG